MVQGFRNDDNKNDNGDYRHDKKHKIEGQPRRAQKPKRLPPRRIVEAFRDRPANLVRLY